jgi:hypothetical protein
MRNKILMAIAFLVMVVSMTGIAAAVVTEECANNGDCIGKEWTGTQIRSLAWRNVDYTGNDAGKLYYYQFRYYQPGTYNANDVDNGGGEGPYNVNTNPNGYFVSAIFEGLYKVPPGFKEDILFSSPIGFAPGSSWTVALMKDGTYPKNNPPTMSTQITSLRVDIPVDIPIPEFSTIALPIASILGLVFFFQHRKKKEE